MCLKNGAKVANFCYFELIQIDEFNFFNDFMVNNLKIIFRNRLRSYIFWESIHFSI